jgi:hypothetical protein
MSSLNDFGTFPCFWVTATPHDQAPKYINDLMTAKSKVVLLPLDRWLGGGTTERQRSVESTISQPPGFGLYLSTVVLTGPVRL